MDEEDDDYDELDEALLDALEDDADQGQLLLTRSLMFHSVFQHVNQHIYE